MNLRQNIIKYVIIICTIILGGLAIYTAIRLYTLRFQPITPNAPESEPEAIDTTPVGCQGLFFNIAEATSSPAPQEQSMPSPESTFSPTSQGCNQTCITSADCTGDLFCSSGYCRNSNCSAEINCVCPVGQVLPTPQPELPQAGFSLPSLLGSGLGIITLIVSFIIIASPIGPGPF